MAFEDDLNDVTCYHCGEKGHLARTCPNKTSNSEAHVHAEITDEINEEEGKELGYIYHQNSTGLSWKTCLLIDSKSSIDIFNNG